MKLLKIITTISFLTIPIICFASGIQVSPARLDFSLADGKPSAQTITIVNPTADVQVFEVYTDDFQDAIKAMPASFTLESGARKTVSLTVDAPALHQDNAKLSTSLSVVGKPLADNKFSVGTGVKIPLTISLTSLPQKSNFILWLYLALGSIIVAIAWAAYNKYKTTKTIN